MPIIANTTLTTRKANTIMSAAFWPRAHEWIFPRVCGAYDTTSLTETHVIGGAAPPMKRYRGRVSSTGMPSWSLTIPNPLHKNMIEIDRSEMEGDQTRTLLRKADEIGTIVAEYPEQLWAARLLKGATSGSEDDEFDGTTYQTTMDGLPFFSATHQLDGVTSQSNIISGNLPQSLTVLQAADIAQMANNMQRDLQKIVTAIKTIKNNAGMPIFPTLDIKKNIVIVVPSALEVVAALAFRQSGAIGGSPGSDGSTGSTDTIAPMFVKDVLCSGYLDGFPDPESETALLAPTYPTTYYVLLVNDRVKPFYVQNFKPVGQNDIFPQGYNVNSVIDEGINAATKLGMDGTAANIAAKTFASTLVEHNLDAVGANAHRDVVEGEKHFVSGRSRFNIAYGPWFTAWQIVAGSVSGT